MTARDIEQTTDTSKSFTRCPYCKDFLIVFDQNKLYCENHDLTFDKGEIEKIHGISFEMKNLIDDKEWLEYNYCNSSEDEDGNFIKRKGFSLEEMSRALEISKEMLVEKIKEQDIPLKITERKDKTFLKKTIFSRREWLFEQYHERKKTMGEIAKEFNIEEEWVERHLKKEKIFFKITKHRPFNLIKLIQTLINICSDDEREYFTCTRFLGDKGLLPSDIDLLRALLHGLGMKNRIVKRRSGKLSGNWIGFFNISSWNHKKKMEFCPSDCPHKKGKCRNLVGVFLDYPLLSQIMAFMSNFRVYDVRSEVARYNKALINFRENRKEQTERFEKEILAKKLSNQIEISKLEEEIDAKKNVLSNLERMSAGDEVLGLLHEDFYERFVDVYKGRKPKIKWTSDLDTNEKLYHKVMKELYKKGNLNLTFFYDNEGWGRAAAKTLLKYDGICQDCLAEGKVNRRNIQIHHLKSVWHYPTMCYDTEYLIPLCVEHHKKRSYDLKEKMLKK